MPRPRPSYHLTATRNWLNDPNGPLWWDGGYHLFFQHNPEAPRWGPPHWGHAVSRDLVRWTQVGIALSPSPEGVDSDGCWSGCTRIVEGRPTIYYTGVTGHTDEDRIEAVCRATSDGDLSDWRKDPVPLVAGPAGRRSAGFHRDPFVFRDGDRWRMLLGSSTTLDGGRPSGAVISYESDDRERWRYVGDFFVTAPGDAPADLGVIWECPQLVRFEGGDVLLFSVQDPAHPRPLRHALYYVGEVVGDRFVARTSGRLDHGDLFYAPAALDAPGDRKLVWGWIQELGTSEDLASADFAGALSLPRELDLRGDRLIVAPARELTALRSLTQVFTLDAPGLTSAPLPGPHWELEAAAAGPVELVLGDDVDRDAPAARTGSGDPAGILRIRVEADGTVAVQRRAGNGWIALATTAAPHDGSAAAVTSPPVRVYADQDIIEVFIADAVGCTTRLPPLELPPTRVQIRSTGAVQLRLHEIAASGLIESAP